MSAADPGLVGPTFLLAWSSVLSGIGQDDIESITSDAEKRPVSVQNLCFQLLVVPMPFPWKL